MYGENTNTMAIPIHRVLPYLMMVQYVSCVITKVHMYIDQRLSSSTTYMYTVCVKKGCRSVENRRRCNGVSATVALPSRDRRNSTLGMLAHFATAEFIKTGGVYLAPAVFSTRKLVH